MTAGSHGGTSPTEAPFFVLTPACVKLTQAGVITEKGASLEEMPPRDPAIGHFLN